MPVETPVAPEETEEVEEEEENFPIPIPEEQTKEQMHTTISKHSLIKHNQVKALALELMAERFSFGGKPKFTRVSPVFCDKVEEYVYEAISNAIRKHTSVGKIIRDF